MRLSKPTDHKKPYSWATALLGHFFVGIVMWSYSTSFLHAADAIWAVGAGYFLLWEVWKQRLGAGLLDGLVDTAGVVWGASFGFAVLMLPEFGHGLLTAVLVAGGLVAWAGVAKRGKK
jgi:hypothetical protein